MKTPSSISSSFNAAASSINEQAHIADPMIAAAPPEQRKFLEAQKQNQMMAQLVELITASMKKMDEMAKSILRNIA